MKIYDMPRRTECPYLEIITVHKRARNWIYLSMQILECGMRDIASICGYNGDEEFLVFVRKLNRNKRLLVESSSFVQLRIRVENAIKKQYIEDKDNELHSKRCNHIRAMLG